MLNSLLGVLAVVVFVHSFKDKLYRYALIPVFLLMYELASDPNQYILFNLTDPNHIGLAEKGILILIFVLCVFAKMKKEDKGRWLPVMFSAAACLLRFVRSFAFDWYTGQMTEHGADVMELYQAFVLCCSIIDVATKLAILLMLVCILWTLSHVQTKKTDREDD